MALGLREQALALPGGTSTSQWVSASAARAAGSDLALGDPASAPDGRLPALIGPRPEVGSPFIRVAVVLDIAALAALTAVATFFRRRRRLDPGVTLRDA